MLRGLLSGPSVLTSAPISEKEETVRKNIQASAVKKIGLYSKQTNKINSKLNNYPNFQHINGLFNLSSNSQSKQQKSNSSPNSKN